MAATVRCPIKETVVNVDVCEKACTWRGERCERARAEGRAFLRWCIDCRHDGAADICSACLKEDPRNRPRWESARGDAPAKSKHAPVQMPLF